MQGFRAFMERIDALPDSVVLVAMGLALLFIAYLDERSSRRCVKAVPPALNLENKPEPTPEEKKEAA